MAPDNVLQTECVLLQEIRPQAFLVASVPASGRLRQIMWFSTLKRSRIMISVSDAGDDHRTGRDFRQVSVPARIAQTLIQPFQVIIVALPLVIPASGFTLKYGGSVTIRSTEFSVRSG